MTQSTLSSWIIPAISGTGASIRRREEFTALLSCYESNLKEQFLGDNSGNNMFSSMVVGEDGYLYLSAFTGQTNNLYRIAMDHTVGYCDATLLAQLWRRCLARGSV